MFTKKANIAWRRRKLNAKYNIQQRKSLAEL